MFNLRRLEANKIYNIGLKRFIKLRYSEEVFKNKAVIDKLTRMLTDHHT